MDTKDLIEKGERLYESMKAALEAEHMGKYVAVDVYSKAHFLGDSAAEALDRALNEKPDGFFHVVHIGSRSADRLSSVISDASNWHVGFLW